MWQFSVIKEGKTNDLDIAYNIPPYHSQPVMAL
jgi:hypothetical protein